jgi:FKBP-type peptidyl-prolyl cis-trans isomerase FklB
VIATVVHLASAWRWGKTCALGEIKKLPLFLLLLMSLSVALPALGQRIQPASPSQPASEQASAPEAKVYSNTQHSHLSNMGFPKSRAQQLNPAKHEEMLGYAMGYSFGISMAAVKNIVTPEMSYIRQGYGDYAQAVPKPWMPYDAVQKVLSVLDAQDDKSAISEKVADDFSYQSNLRAGREFLATNGKRGTVKQLLGGIQYEVLQSGFGAVPKITDIVEIHYRGKNTNGEEFLSSYQYGVPWAGPVYHSEFTVWEHVLPKMKAGDKWRVYAPNELALGKDQFPPHIKAGDVVVFDIELLKVTLNPYDLQTRKSSAAAPAPK